MKKTLFRIFALVITICTLFSLASCFAPKPELDLETAKENLEDADYSVTYTDDEDKLSVNVVERLTASEKDDSDNYLSVTVYADAKSAKIAYQEMKDYLDYSMAQQKLAIKEIENLLKNYEDDLESDEIDEYEDELKELKKELEEMKDEYVIGKSGKTVWYGTKEAIEKSKG